MCTYNDRIISDSRAREYVLAKAVAISTITFLFLTIAQIANAGIWDNLFCSEDITERMRGNYSATYDPRVFSYLVIELRNSSSNFRITSTDIELEAHDNMGNLRRLYSDQKILVEPKVGARLYIPTEFSSYSSVVADRVNIKAIYGCAI